LAQVFCSRQPHSSKIAGCIAGAELVVCQTMPRRGRNSKGYGQGQSQWQKKPQQNTTDVTKKHHESERHEEKDLTTRSAARTSPAMNSNGCTGQSQSGKLTQQQSPPPGSKKHEDSEFFEEEETTTRSSVILIDDYISPSLDLNGCKEQSKQCQEQQSAIGDTKKHQDSESFEEEETTTRSSMVFSDAMISPPTDLNACKEQRQELQDKQQQNATDDTEKHQDGGCCEEEETVTNSLDEEVAHLQSKPILCDDFYTDNDDVTRGVCFAGINEHEANGKLLLGEPITDAKVPSELVDPAPSKERKTVAIFADYDGCFDMISPSNPAGAKMDKMFDYAEQIGRLLHPRKYAQKLLEDFLKEITADAEKVVVFSGSNRQSHKADEFNSVQNDNGLAMVGLKKLAEEKGWEFDANLLEDVGLNPSDIMNSVGGSSKIKQMLAENNFKHLKGPTTAYFFDDVEKYLKFTRVNATVPENIEFKTVLFDWYGICIDGTQDAPLIPISAG